MIWIHFDVLNDSLCSENGDVLTFFVFHLNRFVQSFGVLGLLLALLLGALACTIYGDSFQAFVFISSTIEPVGRLV